jgi:6-phosphofructokinase 1
VPKQTELDVARLGACEVTSPLAERGRNFVADGVRVLFDHDIVEGAAPKKNLSFEKAGPRERIFFEPSRTTAAMVTCGGLSPGLNNVIRSAYLELALNYRVARVLGIRNGYAGLNPASGYEPIELTRSYVENIHELGGTVLGSSRGPQDPTVTVDFLESNEIDILFCIGGDGTQRGAHAIEQEIEKRGLKKAVIGIPKTIDNDVPYVWMTFGYITALDIAAAVIRGAHVEATGAPNGVGLVKLMGRDAGYIAAGASIVSQDANFVLVPEVAFPLEGEGGFLDTLERRLADRGHAVVVVAEGAGQHLFEEKDAKRDASGNVRYQDIGIFLRERINAHFAERGLPLNLKYIDPSYAIRSQPAGAWDRVITDRMARNAVHAAMAGKTDVLIGFWNQSVIHVPISVAVQEKKHLSLDSDLWNAVLATTGQPRW